MIQRLSSDMQLAIRNLRRNRRRSLLAILIVTGGLVAYILAGGFINWVLYAMREATILSQLGHAQVSRTDYFRKGIADPYAFLLPGSSSELNRLENAKGVRTVSPRLAISGLVSFGEGTVSFIGEGIDPDREAPIAEFLTIVAGRALKQDDRNGILLGRGLASSLGAKPGDRVVLLSSSSSGAPSAVEGVVQGLFSSVAKDFDDFALRVHIDLARKLIKVDGATTWVVLLDHTEDTSSFIASLRGDFAAVGLQFTPWDDLADFYKKTEALFSRQVGIIKWMIAVILVLSISNTLTMSVMERTSEIGTSMAIGVRRTGVLRVFLFEGVLIGLVSAVIGILLGVGLAELISYVGIPMPPAPGTTEGYMGRIRFSTNLAIDGVLLAVLSTLLASIFPAWKASQMNIVDALRHNR